MAGKTVKALYISYNAITEPIVRSQVIPYLKGLSKEGIKFYLLTFEKNRVSANEKRRVLAFLKEEFKDTLSPEWIFLYYHKKPAVPATLFDVACGIFLSGYIILKKGINIVHARAIIGALMGYPAARLLSRKFIFDTRGVDSEEYVDAGSWKRGGLTHRVVGFLEDALVRSSDHVVVLTKRFLEILEKRHPERNIKFSVVPCAVDTGRFRVTTKDTRVLDGLKAEQRFILVYSGSLGTWYMLKEMLDFFKVARQCIKNVHFLILTQTDRGYVQNSIKAKGIETESFTVDTISYKAMPDYLSVCSAGIFFIKPVFSKLSSSPVKFGEYLASGLPVVINRGIGDTEVTVRGNNVGVVVEKFDEPSYHEAVAGLTSLMKDTYLAERCRSCAEKYLSLDSAVNEYTRIYQNLR